MYQKWVESCCGWNRKLWASILREGLVRIPASLQGQDILEIGASASSSLSPLFAQRGARVLCSFYDAIGKEPVIRDDLKQFIRLHCSEHDRENIQVAPCDLFQIKGLYDGIVMKSVLGGVARNNDLKLADDILEKLLASLRPGGFLLSLDNGIPAFRSYCSLGAAQNGWTLFSRDAMQQLHDNRNSLFWGKGWLSCGAFSTRLGQTGHLIDRALFYMDYPIEKIFHPKEKAVWGSLFFK